MGRLQHRGQPCPPYDAPLRGVVSLSADDIDRLAERLTPDLIGALTQAIASSLERRLQMSSLPVNPASIWLTEPSEQGKRATPARDRVRAYLLQNPSAAKLSARKLGALLDVNHETVNQVLREFRDKR